MRRIFYKQFLRILFVGLNLLMVVNCLQAQAQNLTITGTVVDKAGAPLPGVTIRVKNTQVAVATTPDGRYGIKVPAGAKTLVFSFVGYVTREENIGNSKQVNVTLEETKSDLNEVVVIGYGSVARKDLTGSVASVKMEDLLKAPVKSIDDALAGRVAGVSVVANDGQPGSTNNIKIRGANSITGDNSPLYVVDGFPINGFDLNSLAPTDIESIDILKDASATAIYGQNGSNGVVIITTRRGKVGTPTVNYNGYYGIQHDLYRVPVLSPYEFVKLQLEISPSLYGAEYTTGVGKTLEDYRDVKGIDWYDMVFRGAAQQNHSVSINGGTEKTQYNLTGSILNQDGIIINTGYKRFQGRVTLDQRLSDALKVGITANISNTKGYGTLASANGGFASFMPNIWGYRPIQVDPNIDITTQLQDPDIGNAPPRTNPFLQAQNELRQTTGLPIQANAYIDYNITKNLRLRVTGGVVTSNDMNEQFNNSLTRAGANIVGSVQGINGSETNSRSSSLLNENTLTYTNQFKDHKISAVAGFTQQTYKRSSFGATAIYVPNESLAISGLDEGTPYSITSSSSNWGMESLLGRINYSYKNKYNVTASYRADASSRFDPRNRWGYFPSAAAAWRFSEEGFMKGLKSIIDDAKLRVGYGSTGNSRTVNDFPTQPSLSFVNNGYSFGNAVPSIGAVASAAGNPDLKWETTRQTDAGIDLTMLKGRLSLTVDYYNKTTSNLLLNATLPITTGYPSATKNIGKVSNSGLEFTLNTVNITNKNFQWTTNFNISFNKNKVLELTENQESILTGVTSASVPFYIAKIGKPIAMFYGLIYDGLYQYSDFYQTTAGAYVLKDNVPSNNTANLRGNIRPGDIKFRDINKDGITTAADYTIIGDPNPDFIGGISNNIRYKGFDVNFFFQYVYGNQIMDNNILTFEYGSNPNTNQFANYANRWTPTNQDTDVPRAGGAVTNYNYSRGIKDGSYIKLKTAQIGYTLPTSWASKLGIKSLRLYVSGQNLFVITNYPGSDPDVSVRDTPLTPGYDFSSYPSSRIFVGGASLTF